MSNYKIIAEAIKKKKKIQYQKLNKANRKSNRKKQLWKVYKMKLRNSMVNSKINQILLTLIKIRKKN